MDDIRVLYVEDNPADRELTLHHLQRFAPELRMRVVGTGRETLKVLKRESFDLVLLDYRLPDVDGLQLLRDVLLSVPDIPVLMVTGGGDHEVAVTSLKTGAVDYLIKKPGHLDRLPAAIRRAVGRFRSERSRHAAGLRILYAEHDPADVDLTLRYMAAYAPYQRIETVETGASTLQRLASNTYDLLLLDYRMPDLNGLEILQEMRERGVRVPVVVVTGHGDEETAVQALKLGALDYLVKRDGYLRQLPSTIDRAIAQQALANEKEALLTLNSLAVKVAATPDLSELLYQVAGAAATVLRVEYALVSRVSHDGTKLIPVAWHGIPAAVASQLQFSVGQDAPGQAAARQQVVGVRDIRQEEIAVYQEQAILEGIGGVLSAPMSVQGRLMGVLTVCAMGPRVFTPSEEALLTTLAAYAVVGIDNARLVTEVKRRAAELEDRVQERTRELQCVNARLLEATRLAEEVCRHKSEFLANMSHELRTPLTSILGFSELLEAGIPDPLTGKQARFIRHIRNSGTHLLGLIDDLLDLSRIEAGRLALQPDTLNLSETLTAVVEPFRVRADGKGVTLSLRLPEVPESIVADALRVKQVLCNLLSNAVKFTPAGGSITVMVRGGCISEHRVSSGAPETGESPPTTSGLCECIEISVADTGIGIKADDLSRLFVEFIQLDRSPAKAYQGTGLGLILVKRLVELHGGSVTVTSSGEGQGSTFTVTLPLRPPRTTERILVVVEDARLGVQIALTLRKARFSVDLVGDREAALAQAARVPPSLVILDLGLSGPQGLDVLRRLRTERSPHLPILVLTTVADDLVRKALAMGADEFLVTPVAVGSLTDAVNRLLRR